MEKQDDKPQSTQDQGLFTMAAKKVGEIAGTVAASLGLGNPLKAAKPAGQGVESGIKRPRNGKLADRGKVARKANKTLAKKRTAGSSSAKRTAKNAVIRKRTAKTAKKPTSPSKPSRRPAR